MSPLSIAIQGIGFSPLLTALQGFGPEPDSGIGGTVPWSQARWVRGWPKIYLPTPQYADQIIAEEELIMLIIKTFLEEQQKPH